MFTLASPQLGALDQRLAQRFVDAQLAGLQAPGRCLHGVHPLIARRLVGHALQRAHRYGLQGQRALALFVRLMADVSPTFDLQPDIHRALTRQDRAPDARLQRLIDSGDALPWTLAAHDDSPLGWYLRDDVFALDEAGRLAQGLALALPADRLPASADARLAAVQQALALPGAPSGGTSAPGVSTPDARWVWCAAVLAYGTALRQALPWSAAVFDAGHPPAVQCGLLRVRLALDCAAWV